MLGKRTVTGKVVNFQTRKIPRPTELAEVSFLDENLYPKLYKKVKKVWGKIPVSTEKCFRVHY